MQGAYPTFVITASGAATPQLMPLSHDQVIRRGLFSQEVLGLMERMNGPSGRSVGS
jgi:hypothetical protein